VKNALQAHNVQIRRRIEVLSDIIIYPGLTLRYIVVGYIIQKSHPQKMSLCFTRFRLLLYLSH